MWLLRPESTGLEGGMTLLEQPLPHQGLASLGAKGRAGCSHLMSQHLTRAQRHPEARAWQGFHG